MPRDKGGNPFQVHGNKSWGCLSEKKTIQAKINLVHLHHLLKVFFPEVVNKSPSLVSGNARRKKIVRINTHISRGSLPFL